MERVNRSVQCVSISLFNILARHIESIFECLGSFNQRNLVIGCERIEKADGSIAMEEFIHGSLKYPRSPHSLFEKLSRWRESRHTYQERFHWWQRCSLEIKWNILSVVLIYNSQMIIMNGYRQSYVQYSVSQLMHRTGSVRFTCEIYLNSIKLLFMVCGFSEHRML